MPRTLQPVIYQTSDKEAAIRSMATRNDHSLVFEYNWCKRRILTRYNLVADLVPTIVLPWTPSKDQVIKKWKKEKGLLVYRHKPKLDFMPESDAILFVDMPLTYRILSEFMRARKEIVIYRPPDWSLHDETIDHKYPMSDIYLRVIDSIKSIIGKNENLSRSQEVALQYAGWPKDDCAVFSKDSLAATAGVHVDQVKQLFKSIFIMRGFYVRLDPYKLMVEPKEPELIDLYRMLERIPNSGSGIRIIKFGSTEERIPYFQKTLKALIKGKYVMKYDSVYVVRSGWHKLDAEIKDAIVGVHRDSYMKLRTIVENAPTYPLLETQSEPPEST